MVRIFKLLPHRTARGVTTSRLLEHQNRDDSEIPWFASSRPRRAMYSNRRWKIPVILQSREQNLNNKALLVLIAVIWTLSVSRHGPCE